MEPSPRIPEDAPSTFWTGHPRADSAGCAARRRPGSGGQPRSRREPHSRPCSLPTTRAPPPHRFAPPHRSCTRLRPTPCRRFLPPARNPQPTDPCATTARGGATARRAHNAEEPEGLTLSLRPSGTAPHAAAWPCATAKPTADRVLGFPFGAGHLLSSQMHEAFIDLPPGRTAGRLYTFPVMDLAHSQHLSHPRFASRQKLIIGPIAVYTEDAPHHVMFTTWRQTIANPSEPPVASPPPGQSSAPARQAQPGRMRIRFQCCFPFVRLLQRNPRLRPSGAVQGASTLHSGAASGAAQGSALSSPLCF